MDSTRKKARTKKKKKKKKDHLTRVKKNVLTKRGEKKSKNRGRKKGEDASIYPSFTLCSTYKQKRTKENKQALKKNPTTNKQRKSRISFLSLSRPGNRSPTQSLSSVSSGSDEIRRRRLISNRAAAARSCLSFSRPRPGLTSNCSPTPFLGESFDD